MEQGRFADHVTGIVMGEIGEYSWFQGTNIDFEDSFPEIEYYNLNVMRDDVRVKTVRLKTDGSIVWVELGEQVWHEIHEYDYSMRHLWMAILSWYE
jgi:hypothetical protein